MSKNFIILAVKALLGQIKLGKLSLDEFAKFTYDTKSYEEGSPVAEIFRVPPDLIEEMIDIALRSLGKDSDSEWTGTKLRVVFRDFINLVNNGRITPHTIADLFGWMIRDFDDEEIVIAAWC